MTYRTAVNIRDTAPRGWDWLTRFFVTRRYETMVFAVHLMVAAVYALLFGVTIGNSGEKGNWDYYWQSLPLAALRADLLSSIWYLHSQPPLFNLCGGLFAKLFFPHHLVAIQAFHVVLGALMCIMFFQILTQLTARPRLSLAAALLFALSPALLLYEAYVLYSLPTAFLVLLSLYCVMRSRQDHALFWLVCFSVTLNLLILIRSAFHPLLLVPGYAMVWLCCDPEHRRRAMTLSGLACLPTLGWLAKNFCVFGVVGMNSWLGIHLWDIVSKGYQQDELQELAKVGVIDPMVAESKTYRPALFVRYGFTKTSACPALSRNDFNNINIPDISRVYGRNAARLFWLHPERYVRSVYRAYCIFCRPSATFPNLQSNIARMRWQHKLYVQLLEGRWLMRTRYQDFGTFLFFLLPLAVACYLAQLLRQARNGRGLAAVIRDDRVMAWSFLIVSYAVLVTCGLEFGENHRYKFDTEPAMWLFMIGTFARIIEGVFPARRIADRPAPANVKEVVDFKT